jgi:hypothetical protein
MEARFCRIAFPLIYLLRTSVCVLVAGCALAAQAATYKTANFVVTTQSPELAREIGDAAETWRKQLAMEWLGQEMPAWSRPCPVTAKVGPNHGAGGQTSFTFDRGEVFGWTMSIQGSRERILDSVLPHEITHTVFASHFREPLPRWADEGACTTVEHQSEIAVQERKLIEYLKNKRGIAFSQMFAMKEYPKDVLPLYSQGHSVSQWLIESRGRTAFLAFLADGMSDENWPRAVDKHYGFAHLGAMQDAWLEWVKSGRPRLSPETSLISQQLARRDGVLLASASASQLSPEAAMHRGQNATAVTPVSLPQATAGTSPSPTTTVVATGGSVYATAGKLESARANEYLPQPPVAEPTAPSPPAMAPPSPPPSIYDASRDTGFIRR